jgi:DNA (cytosine-5)-methyltransferase 1
MLTRKESCVTLSGTGGVFQVMNGLSVFSFFSGAGFLDLGFEDSGFEVVFANEVEHRFARAYQHARDRMEATLPRHGIEVKSIEAYLKGADADRLRHLMNLEREEGRLVGFIGGPPCPDFSIGGKNKGRHGENGRLSKTYVDLILQHRPDWFLFENVKGLWRTKRHREFFDELTASLRNVGYELSTRLMNSIEASVPQDRERIFIVGFRVGLESAARAFSWDEGLSYPGRKAFSYDWPSLSGSSETIRSNVPRELTVDYWFDRNNVANHANAAHGFQPRAGLARFQSVLEGDVSKKSFKRLHRNRYSPTAAYGNNEVHIHPTLPRRLTVAEALAIQSLPRNFELPSEMPLSAMFKVIGNGVPYLLGRHVAQRIREALQQLAAKEAA